MITLPLFSSVITMSKDAPKTQEALIFAGIVAIAIAAIALWPIGIESEEIEDYEDEEPLPPLENLSPNIHVLEERINVLKRQRDTLAEGIRARSARYENDMGDNLAHKVRSVLYDIQHEIPVNVTGVSDNPDRVQNVVPPINTGSATT